MHPLLASKMRKEATFWLPVICMAKIWPQINLVGHWGVRALFLNQKIDNFWHFQAQNTTFKNESFSLKKAKKDVIFVSRAQSRNPGGPTKSRRWAFLIGHIWMYQFPTFSKKNWTIIKNSGHRLPKSTHPFFFAIYMAKNKKGRSFW